MYRSTAVHQFATFFLARVDTSTLRLTYSNAGHNHPKIRKAMENKKIYNEEQVRNEMFIHLGYYVTESSGHNSEYNWWFRKRPDLIEKYCTHGTGWNTGVYAYILKEYQNGEATWKLARAINDQGALMKRSAEQKKLHLEAALVLDHRVEDALHDVGVDQVAFHHDGFVDHGASSPRGAAG